MTVHTLAHHPAGFRTDATRSHAEGALSTMKAATGLLAIAATLALGTVGVDAAVLAIAVLVPVVLVGTFALSREA